MNPHILKLRTALMLVVWLAGSALVAAPASGSLFAPEIKRVIFLGDSITYGGRYVAYVSAYQRARFPTREVEIINLGLSSENVSGLSELGHAGGKFPRPDLHERLARVLDKAKPDLVFACYGMNDGIYEPFDEQRFKAFRDGIVKLRTEVQRAGAKIIHLTPPVFDEVKGGHPGYAEVLDRYSAWLIAQRTNGWDVVDLHVPMKDFLAKRRAQEVKFVLSRDGIHPDELGHWLMAQSILVHLGVRQAAAVPNGEALLADFPDGDKTLSIALNDMARWRDAWLTATGHKRPGVKPGEPIEINPLTGQARFITNDVGDRTKPLGNTNEPARAPGIETLASTTNERDARITWWREARFGMFVHWGVSSVLGGTWNGKPYQGYAEHIQRMAKIPVPFYHEKVAGEFNPTNFDADAWAQLAKDTGMGYFIITAKHHDGFAMFDSKASPWNVVDATPWHHDPMKDLSAACKKRGIKFGFYYSHAFDWGEENGAGNDWDWPNPGGDKLLHGADWWVTYPEFLPKVRKYVDEKAIPQILELINNYQPDILWFDTPHKIPPEENLRIFAAVRKADPNIVINGRIFSGANPDWFRLTDYINTGDKPGEFAPQEGDWEGIPTTNESFGYNANDHSHKPPGHFIRLLAKAAARGGNILMNMGPRGDGAVDPVDVKIFQGIGAWWKTNGESIRGTTRTPLPRQAWTGESTRKGNTLYLHVFDWPKNGELLVSGLKTDVKQLRILAAPSAKVAVRRVNEFDFLLTGLPVAAPDETDSVIALECAGEPVVDAAQLITPLVAKNVLQGFDSKLSSPAAYRAGRGVGDAWVVNWLNTNAAVTWKVRVNEKTTFNASLVYDASAGTAQNRLVEGDAGKELAKANSGAGGTYAVTIAGETFERAVKIGRPINELLGPITLAPGEYEVRVAAKEVSGAELFRLRRLVLESATK